MQRRTHTPFVTNKTQAAPVNNNNSPQYPSRSRGGRPKHAGYYSLSNCSLLLLALFLTAATTFFPEVQQAEQSALDTAYQAEQRLQHDVTDWYHQQTRRQASSSSNNNPHPDGQWVAGEKKLKQQLKILANRQNEQKQDIGLPVATRWLGDDLPAWPQAGQSESEWQAAVSQRYDEMRAKEARWMELVQQKM